MRSGLRQIVFPAQSIVERQFRRDAPGVLPEQEEPSLAQTGIIIGPSEVASKRLDGYPSKNDAERRSGTGLAPAERYPASALPVVESLNEISPERCESLGIRCCCARRISAPNLME